MNMLRLLILNGGELLMCETYHWGIMIHTNMPVAHNNPLFIQTHYEKAMLFKNNNDGNMHESVDNLH